MRLHGAIRAAIAPFAVRLMAGAGIFASVGSASAWSDGDCTAEHSGRGPVLKIRRTVTGLVGAAAAAGLLFAGAGMANATGSTGCTSPNYVHQYTSYHGTICYTNTGYDNLRTSGFWTSEVYAGSNTGYIEYYTEDGFYGTWHFKQGDDFVPAKIPALKGDVVSMVGLHIEYTGA